MWGDKHYTRLRGRHYAFTALSRPDVHIIYSVVSGGLHRSLAGVYVVHIFPTIKLRSGPSRALCVCLWCITLKWVKISSHLLSLHFSTILVDRQAVGRESRCFAKQKYADGSLSQRHVRTNASWNHKELRYLFRTDWST
jgi:hypothetical protein